MRSRKYPLDPLARLRDKQVGDAAKLLSDAIRAREAAQRAEEAALAQRDAAVADARAVQEREDGALGRGELRAEDLARAAAWNARVEEDRAVLEARASVAARAAQAAQAHEGKAKDGVSLARAEAQVIARDRSKWEEAGRKKEEAAEEEGAAEAFLGKKA